ncbi:MAG: aspartyl/asparaginyl beta-hydroxylase domain-containing protein, partial [Pseudomonadota bacterium]
PLIIRLMDSATQRQARQNALCSEALDAQEAGDLENACRGFLAAVRTGPSNPVPLLFLGHALAQNDERERAAAAWSLAADRDARIINAWRHGAREDIAVRSKAADSGIRQWFTALHQQAMDAFAQRHPPAQFERIRDAVWCQTHDGEIEFQAVEQRPYVFYVPDLAPLTVFTHREAPWLKALEAAFEDILNEYRAAHADTKGHVRPYLDWPVDRTNPLANLAQSDAWGALHLFKQSEPNASVLAKFPKTLEALHELPLLEVGGHPREVLFSVLAGGERINPHYGLANTDATVHLPLIVPGPAALRVVDGTYPWEPGRALAFDDSFLHESWNDAEQARVTLLFEAWHPDLSPIECDAVQFAFEYRDRWNRRRQDLMLGTTTQR